MSKPKKPWKAGDIGYCYNAVHPTELPRLDTLKIVGPEIAEYGEIDVEIGGRRHPHPTAWLFRTEKEAREAFVESRVTYHVNSIELLRQDLEALKKHVATLMDWRAKG